MSDNLPVFKPQEITRSLYAAVSGPAGPRNWSGTENLFHAEARLVRAGIGANGEATLNIMSFPEFQANVEELLVNAYFHEIELRQEALRFGLVATIRSVYEKRLEQDGMVESGRGLNLINLVCCDDAWKIINIIWDNEREGLPLPEQIKASA